MNETKAYIDKAKEWLAKAKNDLKAAEILIKDNEPPTDTVCYHCQQTAEKYLKGFLTRQKMDFMKTHDLDYLLKLCIKIDIEFENYQDDILSLNKYAIETRYPADIPILYSIDEAKKALETAKVIAQFINTKF